MPAPDPDLDRMTPGLDSPGLDAVAITPADTDLGRPVRGLRIGVAGDLKVTTLRGTVLELRNLASGETVPLAIKRVWATGQTGALAGNVVGYY